MWRAVYAVPEDWYAAGSDRFQTLEVDLTAAQPFDSAFLVIEGDETLCLTPGGTAGAGVTGPSSGTKLQSIRMEYLMVALRRPWLNTTLFETEGWYLSGQDAGFCSSGSLSANGGILPLIPTGLLIGREVNVSVEWGKDDADVVRAAKSTGRRLFLGPFPVSNPGEANSTLHVIGWTSDLVPFSPKMTRNAAGSILVDSSGAFVARFSVEWSEGAERRSGQSGKFPVLSSKELDIPVNASKIVVKIEIMTFPEPVETWKTVAVLPFDKPVMKRFALSGVTWDPVLKEL
jgi:hypothetical protein